MAENTISQLASFDNGQQLDFIEKNGEILFTVEMIGNHLGYVNPAEAINRLFQRNHNELKNYSTSVKLTAIDGKQRETRAFTEEGVYILSMLARTSQAKKFRARVALLLRRIRQEQAEHQATLARQCGYQEALEEAAPKLHKAVKDVWTLGPKDKRNVRRVVKWRAKGLGIGSIAKLMDINARAVSHYLKAAKHLGLLEVPHAG